MPKPDYDTTLARIAGNIAAGMVSGSSIFGISANHHLVADAAIGIAVDIVNRCKELQPSREPSPEA